MFGSAVGDRFDEAKSDLDFLVDDEVVWDVIQGDVPALLQQVTSLLTRSS